jgi:acetyl-CoA synthetase
MSNDSKTKVYPPAASASANAHVSSLEQYRELYDRSINDPDGFWTEHAERLHWIEKWHTLTESDFDKAQIRWFIGGKLNACYNCVDRHVDDGHGDDTALIWEGNDPNESRTFTYAELQSEVQKAANALKDLGLAKGDRVCIICR